LASAEKGKDMDMKIRARTFVSLCVFVAAGVSLSAIPIFYCQKIDTAKSEFFFTVRENEEGKDLPQIFRIFIDGKRQAPLFQKKYLISIGDKKEPAVDMLVSYGTGSWMTAQIDDTECHFDFNDVAGTMKRRPGFDIPDVVTRYEKLKREKYPNQDENVWLLLDRSTEGDDNAEHFYRFLRAQHPDVTPYFTINQKSGNGQENTYWKRLQGEKFGSQPLFSLQPLEPNLNGGCGDILKRASKIISSQSAEALKMRYGPDFLRFKHFIFLQHGVIKDDMSEWLNGKEMDLFVTTTPAEWTSIVGKDTPYKTLPAHGKMLGLPRHDALLCRHKDLLPDPGNPHKKPQHPDNLKNAKNFVKKAILIMPTWRKYVKDATDGIKDADKMFQVFQGTDYFKMWNDFLTDRRLAALAKGLNYRILFFPHSLMRKFLSKWTLQGIEKVTCFNRSIQDVFLESAVMITDYSSTAFEMALLRRPVVYYQFDDVTTQGAHTYQSGYFDYLRDGFGPVVRTKDELFQTLTTLLQNECRAEPRYLERMQRTFTFQDEGNCERVYRAIRELDQPRRPDDFDREVLRTYALDAESKGDAEFASRCRSKLLSTYGD
jgi:CDP-glycerol glycerophosphotransferase (TagB/SpsB family)